MVIGWWCGNDYVPVWMRGGFNEKGLLLYDLNEWDLPLPTGNVDVVVMSIEGFESQTGVIVVVINGP